MECALVLRVHLDELLDRTLQLLERQHLQTDLQTRQAGQRSALLHKLLIRQHATELEQHLAPLHPADLAFLLERLSGGRRAHIWNGVAISRRGSVLIELDDQVRADILSTLSNAQVHACTRGLGADDLAEVLQGLPDEMVDDILARHDDERRADIETALSFPANSAGALMDMNHVVTREHAVVEQVLQELRRRRHLPDHTNQLMVVNDKGVLTGLLSLRDLLTAEPKQQMIELIQADPISFSSDEPAQDVAAAFERYDLITAPVVNSHGHPIGRIVVDEVMDYRSAEAERQSLQQVGLSQDEDWHGPVWEASKRRWQWLGLNLLTAFFASRVIGLFETTIEQFVALATLMPIVASIGGNTGNQTAALFNRGLTRKQVDQHNAHRLAWREVRIGSINGVIWGSVAATFATLVYGQLMLALVVVLAMLSTMAISALAGAIVPLALQRSGRDPVLGTSVILTGITDSVGFLIFLGLASLLLF